MVTRMQFDLDDNTRRLIAQEIDKERGKRTSGRRLATRAEISQYLGEMVGHRMLALQMQAERQA